MKADSSVAKNNILHISRTMGQGGAEKIVYQLCSDAKGFKHYVASTGGFYVQTLEKKNIKHFEIPDLNSKNPVLMAKTCRLLKKIVKEEHIGIVHSHHRMAAFYSQLLFGKSKNIKLIYTAHNVFNNRKRLMRYALKNTDIVAVGKSVRENLVTYYKIDKNRVQTIYNSIKKPEYIKPNSQLLKMKKDGKILVGTITRLSEEKNIDLFIRAISEVVKKEPNVIGVITGDGEEKANLIRLTRQLDISANIIFMGFQVDIFSVLMELDLVVLPSKYEGLPLVPLEAFALEKPIIASNVPGNIDIVQHNQNGLMFNVNKYSDLSKSINLLLNDKPLLEKLRLGSIETYQRYSYDVFISSYTHIYNKGSK